MPRLDGYNAFHKIRTGQATSRIPVVMLTALDFKPHKRLAKKLGVEVYMTKPFNPQDLLDVIGRLLSTS